MRPTELVSASRVAILEQLSASIGEINQPLTALVLNAQAALQLLHAQPTDTGAVRRLLASIVKDGLRTGEIVHRTRALIEKAPPVSETQCPVNVDTRHRPMRFAVNELVTASDQEWVAKARRLIEEATSRT